jgi:putative oxidoreductase
MNTASTISRYLLGVIFVVFGLNEFLNFIPAPLPTGVAGQFIGALFVSHYLIAIMFIQLVAGILLLINRFVPLALTLLGAVIVNILFFHVFMDRTGLPRAAVVIILWFLAAYNARPVFTAILRSKVDGLPARHNPIGERATIR